jgi:hypothetical protein
MAEILSGFTWMPCSEMMYPRSFLGGGGGCEGAFVRVLHNFELPEVVECFLHVGDEAAAPFSFDDDVINIDFQVAPYLPLEAELHTPLIGGPCILHSERHFHLADIAEGGIYQQGRT